MKKIFSVCLSIIITTSLAAQSYEEFVEKSSDYIDKKDFISAEQALKEALRKDPANQANTLLLANLGTVQRNLGKNEEALMSYTAALTNSPKSTSILHSRASLYCETNDYDNAIKDYNTILLIDDKDIEAYYNRALLHMSKNDLPAAKEDFYKITEIAPENALGKMGEALIYKTQNEWIEAEKAYSDLISKYRNNANLYFNRAECYVNLDRNNKAIDDLNKAQELGFEDISLFIMRGQVRLAQYDKISAKLDFTKAKELGAKTAFIDKLIKKCE